MSNVTELFDSNGNKIIIDESLLNDAKVEETEVVEPEVPKVIPEGLSERNTLRDVRDECYFIGCFGGIDRYIRFDLNAFAAMEDHYGDLDKANEALSKGSMKDIRMILWLGLLWNHAVLDEITGEPVRYTLTVHEVGSWLTPKNLKATMLRLMEAMGAALPEEAKNSPEYMEMKAHMDSAANEAAGQKNPNQ